MTSQPDSDKFLLSELTMLAGFLGVLAVFFLLPFTTTGEDESVIDELAYVNDYGAQVTKTAYLVYALWAVPVLAGLGVANLLLALLNGKPLRRVWQSSIWYGCGIIGALFISSAGYALFNLEVEDLNGEAQYSTYEVFLFPIIGIGYHVPGYTLLASCAAVSLVSAWMAGRNA